MQGIIFVVPPTQLPPGWERGYCENKCRYFYFNALTGDSKWNLGEVLVHCGLDKVTHAEHVI